MEKTSDDKPQSLLLVIVNRGMGSMILKFACERGACDASSLFGRGTVNSRLLRFMQASTVEKEIVLILVFSDEEAAILEELNETFHFDRNHHGIAFTMPLAGLMRIRRDPSVRWHEEKAQSLTKRDYEAVISVAEKGLAQRIVQLAQSEGYFGGTLLKGRGSAGESDRVLDMVVEPEREVVLMIMKREAADHLTDLLDKQLDFAASEGRVLVRIGVRRTIGLFEDGKGGRNE